MLVKEEFWSNPELRQGEEGLVEELEEGSAWISFNDRADGQWVAPDNFEHLQLMHAYEDVPDVRIGSKGLGLDKGFI